ncbi:hypothetical protein B0T16DRAFT_183980 [Cercophora newfieldiana]|uniref:Uncharacterized protein n=1 Tax=Cercophora newfieldiana TaxID=92897 RepID=A0AA40CLM7_9PEZI|nr:hypothetical protein B0T16DRAFT_183980 [Cercophora newfieldiana]
MSCSRPPPFFFGEMRGGTRLTMTYLRVATLSSPRHSEKVRTSVCGRLSSWLFPDTRSRMNGLDLCFFLLSFIPVKCAVHFPLPVIRAQNQPAIPSSLTYAILTSHLIIMKSIQYEGIIQRLTREPDVTPHHPCPNALSYPTPHLGGFFIVSSRFSPPGPHLLVLHGRKGKWGAPPDALGPNPWCIVPFLLLSFSLFFLLRFFSTIPVIDRSLW